MKLTKIAVITAALAFVLVPQSYANSIVVPNGLQTVEGAYNNGFPFSVGRFGLGPSAEYQQVYASNQFGPAGSTLDIGSIAFRLDGKDAPGPFTDTYPSVQVQLSTTSAGVNGLSPTFANNLGANNTIVYNGALTLTGVGGSSPNPFSLVINLQTPFLYNSSQGNLLLDVQINGANGNCNGAGICNFMPTLDAVSGSPDTSRVWTFQASNSVTGNADDIGLVTEFASAPTSAPEPSSLVLLGAGLLALGVAVRRKTSDAGRSA